MRKAVGLCLTMLLLVACSKATVPEGIPNSPDPPPGTATGSTAQPATPGSGTVETEAGALATVRVLAADPNLDALIAAYQRQYPNDRVVKVSPISGGATIRAGDIAREKIAAGEVDVVSYIVPELLTDGLLLPLDPFIQRADFALEPFGPALEGLRHEGKLYELPYAISPSILVYNKELFAQAGVAPPTEGWSWEELRAAAHRLTGGEGARRIWGLRPEFTEYVAHLFFAQSGLPLEQAYQDEDLVKDAFALFGTMVQVDQSMPKVTRQRPGEGQRISFSQEFAAGRAAITIMQASSLQALFKGRDPFAYDVAPMPIRPGGGGKAAAPASPRTLGIASNAPNQAAAWRFVSFVAGAEGAEVLARAGSLPAYNSPGVKAAWFDRDPVPPPGTAVLFETAWEFRSADGAPGDPAVQAFRAAVADALNAVMAGEIGWEEGFAQYQRALQEWQGVKKTE